jgi:hypothetical protein
MIEKIKGKISQAHYLILLKAIVVFVGLVTGGCILGLYNAEEAKKIIELAIEIISDIML